MTNKNNTHINVSVPSDLKQRLWTEARRQRRNLSSLVRVLLEGALDLEETLTPGEVEQNEYAVCLTGKQAINLRRRGFHLVLDDAEQLSLPGL